MGYYKRRLIQRSNHVGHSEGLTGAGNAQQGLKLIAFLEARYQLLNCLRLVTGGLIFTVKLEYILLHIYLL